MSNISPQELAHDAAALLDRVEQGSTSSSSAEAAPSQNSGQLPRPMRRPGHLDWPPARSPFRMTSTARCLPTSLGSSRGDDAVARYPCGSLVHHCRLETPSAVSGCHLGYGERGFPERRLGLGGGHQARHGQAPDPWLRLTLALAIRRQRQANGLSQKQLGERIGTTQPRVAKIEVGAPDVSLDQLVRAYAAAGGRIQCQPPRSPITTKAGRLRVAL